MEVYFTSKNSGPSYGYDPVTLDYVGTDLEKAIEAVGSFQKYEWNEYVIGTTYPHIYTVLPEGTDFEFVKFYMADGWWYSVVKVNFEKQE